MKGKMRIASAMIAMTALLAPMGQTQAAALESSENASVRKVSPGSRVVRCYDLRLEYGEGYGTCDAKGRRSVRLTMVCPGWEPDKSSRWLRDVHRRKVHLTKCTFSPARDLSYETALV